MPENKNISNWSLYMYMYMYLDVSVYVYVCMYMFQFKCTSRRFYALILQRIGESHKYMCVHSLFSLSYLSIWETEYTEPSTEM